MFRLLEIILTILLLILLFPFFLIAIILVRIDSPGPIIFKQKRVGFNSREFTLYKLRTMKQNANGSYPPHTQINDPRFSPLCRFIRASCIDEVPQLWNILKGDMKLIGPRPELPKIVKTYTPDQRNVLKYKPGLLGISQLVLREGVNYKQKLTIENSYYPNRSLWRDFMVFSLTPFVIASHAMSKMFKNGNGDRSQYTDTRWFKLLVDNRIDDVAEIGDTQNLTTKTTSDVHHKADTH